METILLFIKHHLKPVWGIVDWINGILFSILYLNRQNSILDQVFKKTVPDDFEYRQLSEEELPLLYFMINEQPVDDLAYFQPHSFSMRALKKQHRKSSFLMMGVFYGDTLAGYFFLRFFFNKKCFVGRLIDKNYRGRGIGREMNRIMYETAWRMKFRCLSTISSKNTLVMDAHSRNETMKVLKYLKNDYMLVEFVKQNSK